VLLLAAFGAAVAWFGNPTRSAQETCHDFVKDRLKAPATAKFESFRDARIEKDGDVFTVEGHVDSENGFGALIRNDYECVVRDDGDVWTLESLELLDE
jgi:hypothetical protein